jgi:hypothetical protein
VSFASPIDAVHSGDRVPTDLTVVAAVETGTYAAVVVNSETWRQPEAIVCERTDSGWEVISEGSGCTRWTLTDEATDRGVMFCWGPADPGVAAYDVRFRGRTWRVPVQNGHYAWLVPDIDEQAFDDPANFTPIS